MTEYYILIILLIFSIAYLVAYGKLLDMEFIKNFNGRDYSMAANIIKTASLASSAILLVHISQIAANANRFYLKSGIYGKALLFTFSLYVGTCIVSYLVYRVSYLIVSTLTTENEMESLRKNDIALSLYHTVILITISFILSPLLSRIASSYIPYPPLPF